MPTKDTPEQQPVEAPATNVKAGFPSGPTTSDLKPTDPGQAQPSGQDGPSASASPGVHVIDDGSEPLPGQPAKDSASSANEVKVVREETPPKKK